MLKFEGDTSRPREIETGSEAKNALTVVNNAVKDSEGKVATWKSNQNKWHKLRMRIKKEKNYPFPDCANIRMPTIDTNIRKIKAGILNMLFSLRPIVQVIPTPSGNWESAKKVEKFLDHLIMDKMNLKEKAMIDIDQTLEKGFYLFKPYWKTDIQTRTENLNIKDLTLREVMWVYSPQRKPQELFQALIQRFDVDMHDMIASHNIQELEGAVENILKAKTKFDIELQDVTYNFPDVALCPPERVFVPPTSGFNPDGVNYLVHEFFLPFERVKSNAEHKGWDAEKVTKINDKADLDPDEIDTTKDEREGIERLQGNEQLVKIWEYYGYFELNGENQKCIITVAPDFGLVLRKVPLPFYSGKYPFIKTFFELTDDRWFSHRGIPEIIEDIVKEIDIQHMQKIDQQTIRNTPTFLFRQNMINPNTMQFAFGQGVPVHGMQDLDDVVKPLDSANLNVEYSYKDEQMILESKVEELLGQVDFSLHSMINRREPRKATEVQGQMAKANSVFGLDVEAFRLSYEKLFNWIWDLWCQYGEDKYEFNYFGREATRQGGQKFESIKLTKEEIQGDYRITIRGNDKNTNPQVRLQKASQILQAMNNEMAVQMGVIQPENIANAYKRFFQELDQYDWEEMVTIPDKKQRMQQQKQAMVQEQRANLMDMASKVFGELTDEEQSQILSKLGIKPDIDGRALRKFDELTDKQTDKQGEGNE